ncbi:MAG: hypothetical protein MI922_16265 [Bacteroidales bacterium]|nr:hypothetical protein [Bacteroidales bacterium]
MVRYSRAAPKDLTVSEVTNQPSAIAVKLRAIAVNYFKMTPRSGSLIQPNVKRWAD